LSFSLKNLKKGKRENSRRVSNSNNRLNHNLRHAAPQTIQMSECVITGNKMLFG
jgi:hypothetical protein